MADWQRAMIEDRIARSAPDKAKWEALNAEGKIEWHSCGHRHGVIRNVPKAELGEIAAAVDYVMGDRSSWSSKVGSKLFDVEFVYQCTGGSAERCSKPWQYCGTTVLFADWQARIEAARAFRPGDQVSFSFKGERFDAVVTGAADRVTLVVPGRVGKWYMPADELVRR